MNFSSNCFNQQLSFNDSIDSVKEESLDVVPEELENMLPFKKWPPGSYDLCISAAVQDILQKFYCY